MKTIGIGCRPADGSPLDEETIQVVSNLRWPHGPCRALLRQKHVGLRGQWLGCWSPKAVMKYLALISTKYEQKSVVNTRRAKMRPACQGSREIGLILEDDNEVSPHFWRWLRAAHYSYGPRRDLAGITLQRLHFCQQIGCPDAPEYPAGGPADIMLNPV